MLIEKEITINKSIHDAWKVLGHDFANPSKWASAVNHSEGGGKEINEGQCSERGCSTTMGKIRERLFEFSNEKFTLGYEIIEGKPFIVDYASNTWQLFELGKDKTKLKIKMDIRFSGLLGKIVEPIMKLQMSKMGNQLVEDFAYYVEHGSPHPRKLKQLNK